MVHAPQTEKGIAEAAAKWNSGDLGRGPFNCRQETFRLDALTNFYDDGTNETLSAPAVPTWWHAVPLDSAMSDALRFASTAASACSREHSTAKGPGQTVDSVSQPLRRPTARSIT
jgi:hypothetical protein